MNMETSKHYHPDQIALPKGKIRYSIAVILLLLISVSYADRVNVSILIADTQFLSDMGLTGQPARQGLLMTVFLIPYFITNLFAGQLGGRVGPRIAMTVAVVLWSISLFISGAARNLGTMLGARAFLGFGEAVQWPMMVAFVRNWFPVKERAKANSIWALGLSIGPAIGLPLVAYIVGDWGWRASFFFLAALGLLLPLPVVWFLTSDHPRQHRSISKDEVAYIEAHLDHEEASQNEGGLAGFGAMGVKGLLKIPNFWILVVGYMCLQAIFFGSMMWVPQYMKMSRGFSLAETGAIAALPWIIGALSTMMIGFVSDKFQKRGIFFSIGLFMTSFCLYMAVTVSDRYLCIAFICLNSFFNGWCLPMALTIFQSIVPGRMAATGAGVMNGVGGLLGGAMSPVIVGALIGATGSYYTGFLYFIALGILGGTLGAVLAFKKI